MNGLYIVLQAQINIQIALEIGLTRLRTCPYGMSVMCSLDGWIDARVNCVRLNIPLVQCFDDAMSNFSAVGNQDRRQVRALPVGRQSGKRTASRSLQQTANPIVIHCS